MSGGRFIYRIYDKKTIVYVGITGNIEKRLRQHSTAGWYQEHYTSEYAEMSDVSTAKMIETYFIKSLRPIFNKAENCSSAISFMSVDDGKIGWKDVKIDTSTDARKVKTSAGEMRRLENGGVNRREEQLKIEFFKKKTLSVLAYPDDFFFVMNNRVYCATGECYDSLGSAIYFDDFIRERDDVGWRVEY